MERSMPMCAAAIAEPSSWRRERSSALAGDSCAVAGTYPVPVGAPETITTERLLLRRPVAADAEAMQQSYAGDAEVTKLLGWPRHLSVDDTLAFISWSDEAWSIGPAGPYVIADRHDVIIGSTGLDVETAHRAGTGYVLARHAWGHGYATEATRAMANLADQLGIGRLYALCHPDNRASVRVLEKAGFSFEGVLPRHTVFPNLDPTCAHDVECWARVGST
jgi:RimJ/RimL family protein N-acetyltransferase